MTVSMKTEVNLSGPIGPLWTKKDSEIIADKMVDTTVERIDLGRDGSGAPFAEYSPKYASRHGKVTVNLRRSGLLLRSIKPFKVSATEAVVTIPLTGKRDAKGRPLDLYKWAVHKRRPFMGISPVQERIINTEADKLIEAKLAKANRQRRKRPSRKEYLARVRAAKAARKGR